MKGRRLLAAVALVAAVMPVLPSNAGPVVNTPVSSFNVTHLGTIPVEGAVGGHIKTVQTLYGERRYLIMTGVGGVYAFDLAIPEAPLLVSHLPLPHWENEDVSIGGDLLIVSVDPLWAFADLYGHPEIYGGLYLIDLSALPALTFAYTNPATGNRWTAPVMTYNGHTTTCIRTDCSYAVVNGSNPVTIVDLRTPSAPLVVRTVNSGACSTHDAELDSAGIVWMVGSCGMTGWDMSNPAAPVQIAGAGSGGLAYHHNSARPRASEWVPRAPGDVSTTVKAGELLMITEEEIYGQVACQNQGQFQTRWLRDTDALTSGAAPTVSVLDTWETELSVAGFVSPAPLCSAHYFDEQAGIVAIAWYEQGVRFLDVSNPRDIRQVGYFIGPGTVAWNVKWAGPGTAGGQIVYTMDGTRGVDILRFDSLTAQASVTAPILPQWTGAPALPPIDFAPHPTWGYACRLTVA